MTESGLRVIIEADGGSRGNPGPAGYGAVVFDAATGEVLAERFDYIGIDTNNVAEYKGLIAGLLAATELGATSVVVRMDSKLVIEQSSGRWQVKHPSMRPLAREVSTLLADFAETSLEWIPRELNKHADHLANRAMDIGQGRPEGERRPPVDQLAIAAASSQATAGGAWTPPEGTPTRLILVRHGSTEHSPQRRYSGRNALPLSDLGRRQVAALAARATTDRHCADVSAVVSSPLPRASQSAEAIASAIGRTVEFADDLVEADFGRW